MLNNQRVLVVDDDKNICEDRSIVFGQGGV